MYHVQENVVTVFTIFFPARTSSLIWEIHSYEAEEVITGGDKHFKKLYWIRDMNTHTAGCRDTTHKQL
jgi:hypothetical protein